MCEGRKVNLKTGNPVVDAVGKMNYAGNVIPEKKMSAPSLRHLDMTSKSAGKPKQFMMFSVSRSKMQWVGLNPL